MVDRFPAAPALTARTGGKEFRESENSCHHAFLSLIHSRHAKEPAFLRRPAKQQIPIIEKPMQQKAVVAQIPVFFRQTPQIL